MTASVSELSYYHGDALLVGRLVRPPPDEQVRPGILVAPEWWGMNDYAMRRAEQLADLGYVALVIDMYGDGKSTDDPEQAAEWARTTRTGALARERAVCAYQALEELPNVDSMHIGAVGFCFGGSVVLELARSGAPLQAAVAFHASFSTPAPARAGDMCAAVLALHGADDAFISSEERHLFEVEMRQAGVDWELVVYGRAVHSFSNPDAGKANMDNVSYHAVAARRAWTRCIDFLGEKLAGHAAS